MDKKYSEQYMNLYKFIQDELMHDDCRPIVDVIYQKTKKHQDGITVTPFFMSILCVIFAIVCIFTPWKKGIWIFLLSAILLFLTVFLIIDIFERIETKNDTIEELKKADRIFLEQERPCHHAVAGYFYYSAHKKKSKIAKARLDKLLETTELLEYFNENGLALTDEMREKDRVVGLSWLYIDEYKKYVTKYYGDKIKHPENFELFYESNEMMFDNQIKQYDNPRYIKKASEDDLYSLVREYHSNWCSGDSECRELFQRHYLDERVREGCVKSRKEMADFYANNPSVFITLEEGSTEFFKIIDTVFNIDEHCKKLKEEQLKKERESAKKTERLLSMLMELPPKLEEVEKELQSNEYTSEEVTLVACRFAENCFCECRDFEWDNDRKPEKAEVHSSYIYPICEMLLKYGLDPKLVLGEKHSETNIIYELRYIDNMYKGPETIRLMLENGGSTQTEIDNESIFSMIDFDVVFDVVELDDKELFDKEFRIWLLMIGYGAVNNTGKCPLNVVDGYDVENFKEFEKFSYKIEFLEKDWTMHIFDNKINREVAKL